MDDKQKCMMCDALLARTFFDLEGKRIYLCQQDANALLRVAFKYAPLAMRETYKTMETMVYGKEVSELDETTDSLYKAINSQGEHPSLAYDPTVNKI